MCYEISQSIRPSSYGFIKHITEQNNKIFKQNRIIQTNVLKIYETLMKYFELCEISILNYFKRANFIHISPFTLIYNPHNVNRRR